VLIDDQGQIIAGHGRVTAAKLLGIKEVPSVKLSHLSDTEERACVLADNQLAAKAGWDREILAIELQAGRSGFRGRADGLRDRRG
jgi:ParB-like chromosome segregation protein Spo0J